MKRSTGKGGAAGAGFFLLLAVMAIGGTVRGLGAEPEKAPAMTGNIRVDMFGLAALREGPLLVAQEDLAVPLPPKKSPWLAAGLSALIPGAGEFYAESYWKAAVFFAIDVAAVALAISADRKGDDQTAFYKDFADRHWSVVKYAKYAEGLVPAGRTYNWRVPGTEGMNEWDRPWSQVNWAELNRMERDIAGYYSHTLPPYGEQQYFELIGKYPQFNQGWDDAPAAFNYGDPLTANFLYYSGERGKANDHYTNATRFVTVAVVNHILSAVDAAWSAHLYNRAQVSTSLRLVPTPDGSTTMMSRLDLRWEF